MCLMNSLFQIEIITMKQIIRVNKNTMYSILVDDDDNDDVINIDLIRDALMTMMLLVLIELKMC